jgi:hypothetical protein
MPESLSSKLCQDALCSVGSLVLTYLESIVMPFRICFGFLFCTIELALALRFSGFPTDYYTYFRSVGFTRSLAHFGPVSSAGRKRPRSPSPSSSLDTEDEENVEDVAEIILAQQRQLAEFMAAQSRRRSPKRARTQVGLNFFKLLARFQEQAAFFDAS